MFVSKLVIGTDRIRIEDPRTSSSKPFRPMRRHGRATVSTFARDWRAL